MSVVSTGSVEPYPSKDARIGVTEALGSPIPAISIGPMSQVRAMQVPVEGSTAE